eukprot:TRINITY_DN6199_c0_g6_i1.p1 TRINITY_DN6199_c0_g6~~TRINITY_DN6199_c0_g6_i1.p1  ORF type:complete len:669 (+),score=119.06 TRINITY_DN6199_c0_g6_i1:3-2009(+)
MSLRSAAMAGSEHMLATQAYISQELDSLRRYLSDDLKLELAQREVALKGFIEDVLKRNVTSTDLATTPKGLVQAQSQLPKVSHGSLTWAAEAVVSPREAKSGVKISPFAPLASSGYVESEHGNEGLPQGMKYLMARHWQSSKSPEDENGATSVEDVNLDIKSLPRKQLSSQSSAPAQRSANEPTTVTVDAEIETKATGPSLQQAEKKRPKSRKEKDQKELEKLKPAETILSEDGGNLDVVQIKRNAIYGSGEGGGHHGNLDQELYDVKNFYKTSGWAQAIARSAIFEQITMAVIAVNAVYIGVDVDNNQAATALEAEPGFVVMDNAFCMFFTFELIVRFVAFAKKMNCLKDFWFVFDSLLVGLMVAETWVMTAVLLLMAESGGQESPSLPTGPLRLLRLLRLSRLVRLLRSLPELITLINGMKASSRGVMCALGLILIINYVFAIILNMFLRGVNDEFDRHFGTLGLTMWTLALAGTLMDGPTGYMELIRNLDFELGDPLVAWSMILAFTCYVLLTNITVMNMLIGIVCEVVSEVKKADEKQAAITIMQQHLRGMLIELDTNGDDQISRVELSQIVNNEKACRVLSELEVEPRSVLQLTEALFEEDEDRGDQPAVTREELLELILNIRGDRDLTMQDLINVQLDLRKVTTRHFEEMMAKFNEMLAQRR